MKLKSGSGATQATLRGLGRCPTLSSLTLVLYVSGFDFDAASNLASIDYDKTPDDSAGTSWQANFLPASPYWPHVKSERIRAFVVPCTFQPGCAYPEVSDACEIQIEGLDGIRINSGSAAGDFGFDRIATSHVLGDALKVMPAERMWGGNEGPLAWRAAALDATPGSNVPYAFAGTKSFSVPLSSPPRYDANAGKLSWSPMPPITLSGVTGLVVRIIDSKGTTLQTLNLDLPSFTISAPTIDGEGDHMDGSATQVEPSYYMCLRNRLLATQENRAFLIQPGDIGRSVEAATDLRVIAALDTAPSTLFEPHPSYALNANNFYGGSPTHNLRFADGTSVCGASGYTQLLNGAAYPTTKTTVTGRDWSDGKEFTFSWITSLACSAPTSSSGSGSVSMTAPHQPPPPLLLPGDWDTGPGFSTDGAQINLPDAGTTLGSDTAYFSLTGGQVGAPTRRTPNALVPSPVIFGSLPAGIDPLKPEQSQPWRTLLFCPNPAAGAAHPGFATPPDYLLLDHFWMPVIEPYAISTRMATAGKINLNDQITPFGYLHRNTAFHALLHDLRIPAIPIAMAGQYKSSGSQMASIWKAVDEDATIQALEKRFASGDAYLTEGEVCAVPLIPQGVTSDPSSLTSFWNGSSGAGRLTGDNLRELPYAQLYGRLTTRSNSYTVHVHVQVLKKLPNDPDQGNWKEDTDLVLGDWRGSYEIERYLDPAAQAPTPGTPLGPYRFRIVSSRRFSP